MGKGDGCAAVNSPGMTHIQTQAASIRARISVITLLSYPPAGATVELKGEVTGMRAAIHFTTNRTEHAARLEGKAPNYLPQFGAEIGTALTALEMMVIMQAALETWERLESQYIESQAGMDKVKDAITSGELWQGLHGVPVLFNPSHIVPIDVWSIPDPTPHPSAPASYPKPVSSNPASSSCQLPSDPPAEEA